ncbi:MAG TPA: alpha/beta hydrolase-fold protein [Actinomycetota bacterium]|nr:alpha/beta hydrolase-fold protein [Actinomycetota bacterium]
MTREGGPQVLDETIRFSFPDPERDLAAVRLNQDLVRPRNGPEFVLLPGTQGWVLHFPRLDVGRMEYKLELVHHDRGSEWVCDPWNDRRVGSAFGDKSVIELRGYRAPEWLGYDGPRGSIEAFELRSRAVRAHVAGSLWTSPGASSSDVLPMLVVHDGPEYDRLSALTTFLDHCVVARRLPAMRAALIAPPADRNETYSASAGYARALAHEVLPKLTESVPTAHGRGMRVGMGASLGGLAMLHVHRFYPATFGGLFLQSGSFFRQRFDKQESGFPRFRRIARFVGQVLRAGEAPHPIPVTMTCGTVEENLANNLAIRDALVHQGYDVSFVKNRDAHNYTAWRDTFDTHLVDLLAKAWG